MADLLIRGVDDDDLAAIDALATRLGISRSELLRRETRNLARRGRAPLRREDLDASAALVADVLDDEVMKRAWR